jgi:cyclin B
MSRNNLIKKSKDKIRNKEVKNIKMSIKDKKNEYKNKIKNIKEEEEKNSNENDDINKIVINDKNIEKYNEKNNEEIIKENEKNNEIDNNNKDNLILLYEDENEEIRDQEEKILYFDTTKINNIQIPKDYLNIIYYNLLKEEMNELNPKAFHTYMKIQKEINDQMRSILVDWIIDVHHKFGFTDETLFLTISIIDRYCSIENITRIKYQCLGITALMIACKHEEINVPKVEDFIYITDNAYTKDEVFQMENDVLDKLNFSLLYPSPIKFYEYLSLHFNFSKKHHMLGKYLMESFLLDLKYIKYKPSVISCACSYIVMKFFKMPNYRHSYDKKFYLVDENANTIPNGLGVKDCAQDICVFVDNINNTNLLSCQKKYTKTEFESVATLISNNK